MVTEEKIESATDVVSAPSPAPAPSSDSGNRLDAARRFAAEQYEKIRNAAAAQMENVRQYTGKAREQLNQGWDETCKKAKELHEAGEAYVKANPTGSVLGAFGVGLILGLLLRGGRH